MPTYQYACTECGDQLEAVQSFSDPALTECPACHGKLRKVFNSVGIVFKGSGFYRNDSRAGDASGEKTPADNSAPDSSSTTKSDAKPSTSSDSSSSSSSSTSSTAAPSSSSPSSSGTKSGGTKSSGTKAPAAS